MIIFSLIGFVMVINIAFLDLLVRDLNLTIKCCICKKKLKNKINMHGNLVPVTDA